MKQVLQARSAFAIVRNVPPPPCLPGGVLVRTAYSAISSGTERSRVELSSKSLLGKALERPDLVREVINRARREGWRQTGRTVKSRLGQETAVGYSSAGEVIEVGEHVRGMHVGDRVACAGGGHANHAEIASMPANLCAKVPEGVPMKVASLATISAVALHGVRLADVSLGERVAVVGCGLVGQITIRLLHAAGAHVIAFDIDEDRIEDARRSGAAEAFAVDDRAPARGRAATAGIGADAVIVTAASSKSDPLLLGAQLARDRGTLVLVGAVPVAFPRASLYDKELCFRVSRSYGPGRYDLDYEERGLDYPIGYVRWTEQRNVEAVLQLVARGQLELEDLIEETFPVQDAERAYRRLVGDNGAAPRGALLLSYHSAPAAEAAPRQVPELRGNTSLSAASVEASTGPLRLGLLGPGGFARRTVVPAFLAAGAELEMVGGGAGPSAAAAQRELGFVRVAESEEALVTDDRVNVVAVCTRHGSHAVLAARALRAGHHVFCEKPLALTSDELEAVMEAATSSKRVLAVGFNRRFAPMVGQARAFLAAESGPMICTFRVSAGAIEPEHWVHDLSQGGGRMLGEGCHFVDTLVYLAGSRVVEVYARGHARGGLPLQAADDVLITLSFADGSMGSIAYVAEGSPKIAKERMEAFRGSRTVVLDDYLSLTLHDGQATRTERSATQDKGHRAEVAAFLAGASSGHHPVPLAEVANVSLATLAIVESLRTGQPVRLVYVETEAP